MENISIYNVRLLTVPGFRVDSVLDVAQNSKPQPLKARYVKCVPDLKTDKITDLRISAGISRNVQSTQLLK